ncbi:hypothetical protein DNK06_08060 [Pseudomonas daroniae]|uniref:Uncharacterized protein n=1 Tax=Phytopseudomonas daroniae TaxID=2487519 RepID=A0A4Q9QMV2_9GAMM|nr:MULTISPECIES: hypothetical protein [Pseudomonas]TBU81063.1 hypothetical protein DNK06_08060 [Pseudomonas daroniae]TBU83588.1 hypothetical protein DNK31_08825 [Pseudomonas sp. FRB 228]TBU86221.1 hypothetical protein DNJ99_24785 [Pseudomonas daroniae]
MQPSSNPFITILADIEQEDRKLIKQKRDGEKSTSAYRVGFWVFWGGFVGSLAVSLVLAFFAWWAPSLAKASIVLLLLSYGIILVYPLLGAWLYRSEIGAIYRAPFASFLIANMVRPLQVDEAHLKQLVGLPKTDLQLGISALKNNRKDLAQRIALVVGPAEKVGVFPGVLAMFVTLKQLEGQPDWVLAIAYATPVFFVIAVIAHHLCARQDRMIALAELALSHQCGKADNS